MSYTHKKTLKDKEKESKKEIVKKEAINPNLQLAQTIGNNAMQQLVKKKILQKKNIKNKTDNVIQRVKTHGESGNRYTLEHEEGRINLKNSTDEIVGYVQFEIKETQFSKIILLKTIDTNKFKNEKSENPNEETPLLPKNKGAGSLLLEELAKYGKTQGITILKAENIAPDAEKFYEKMNFKPSKEYVKKIDEQIKIIKETKYETDEEKEKNKVEDSKVIKKLEGMKINMQDIIIKDLLKIANKSTSKYWL